MEYTNGDRKLLAVIKEYAALQFNELDPMETPLAAAIFWDQIIRFAQLELAPVVIKLSPAERRKFVTTPAQRTKRARQVELDHCTCDTGDGGCPWCEQNNHRGCPYGCEPQTPENPDQLSLV